MRRPHGAYITRIDPIGHLNLYERIPSKLLASVQLSLTRQSRKLSHVGGRRGIRTSSDKHQFF